VAALAFVVSRLPGKTAVSRHRRPVTHYNVFIKPTVEETGSNAHMGAASAVNDQARPVPVYHPGFITFCPYRWRKWPENPYGCETAVGIRYIKRP